MSRTGGLCLLLSQARAAKGGCRQPSVRLRYPQLLRGELRSLRNLRVFSDDIVSAFPRKFYRLNSRW